MLYALVMSFLNIICMISPYFHKHMKKQNAHRKHLNDALSSNYKTALIYVRHYSNENVSSIAPVISKTKKKKKT